jgi:hypothetical protein
VAQYPLMSYETRLLDSGWAVWDVEAGSPTSIAGRWQTGMTMPEARKVSRRLNRIAAESLKDHTLAEEDLGGRDICSLETEPSTDGDKPLD